MKQQSSAWAWVPSVSFGQGVPYVAVMMLSKRLLLSSAIGIVAFALMRHFS